jgi:TM2 domain-containing membrane protein YozV/ribosomal protein L40E
MRCPKCGALNPDTAEWCNQCYERFRPPDPEPELEPTVQAPSAQAPAAPVPDLEVPLDALASPDGVDERGMIRREGVLVGWSCRRCGQENTIEANLCAACGTSLFEAFGPAGATRVKLEPKNPGAAAALSVVPGAGHFYLGRTGEGVARIALALWWLLAGLLLSGAGALAPLRFLFLAALAALILVSVWDAFRQAQNPEAIPILGRSMIIYVTLALVGVSTVGALFSMLAARR